MAIPAIPTNFQLQQGNGEVLATWNLMSGATSYSVERSIDGITYAVVSSPSTNLYLDSTVTVGTKYYYKVASVSASGTSSYTSAKFSIPTNTGDLSLSEVRDKAKQRADMVNSQFVSDTEWNSYINQSYFELYDLLVTAYEDYFLASAYEFQTDGSQQYNLPSDFYKLKGVDCGLSNSNQAFATLRPFNFVDRNQYVFPQMNSTLLGVFDLRYRLMGSTLFFIPTPTLAQTIRVWYVPKLTQLLEDTDILTGISGWSEYVIVDAAIKAMQKEESDVSILLAQKQALIKRIEESSQDRDEGMTNTVSDSRSRTASFNGAPFGSWGGY